MDGCRFVCLCTKRGTSNPQLLEPPPSLGKKRNIPQKVHIPPLKYLFAILKLFCHPLLPHPSNGSLEAWFNIKQINIDISNNWFMLKFNFICL